MQSHRLRPASKPVWLVCLEGGLSAGLDLRALLRACKHEYT
jgi:hypothetical protein